ncbi:hypothetical protein [Streptomyces sp. JW3]
MRRPGEKRPAAPGKDASPSPGADGPARRQAAVTVAVTVAVR